MSASRTPIVEIATTGDRFGAFAPYVPAIGDDGAVAFWARARGGRTGVFSGDGTDDVAALAIADDDIAEVVSHPAVDSAGRAWFYARLAGGGDALVCSRTDRAHVVAAGARFRAIGPLGPTANRAGAVAFRATDASGRAGVFAASAEGAIDAIDAIDAIAAVGARFAGFHGLPVIADDGAVAFRADLERGGHGVYIARGGRVDAIVETGDRFVELGRFPAIGGDGAVAFAAVTRSGAGVFAAVGPRIETIADATDGFESFRGVLRAANRTAAFYATPEGGTLGVYTGRDPSADRLLGIGDPLLGSTVAGFALNPVSVNRRGQLAIRVTLTDGRGAIVRAGNE